jgi:hypothetical protein
MSSGEKRADSTKNDLKIPSRRFIYAVKLSITV